MGFFQEDKVTKGICMRESIGYRVVATDALRAHSSSIAVLYRSVKHFSVEALQTYRANIVIFQLASGDRRWFIMGCYLAPDNASTIEDIVATIRQRLRGGARCWWLAISTLT